MSLPTSADEVRHGSLASEVLTLDENVDPEDRVIDTFTAIAGDDRGLVIDAGLDLEVVSDFTRSLGTGAYVTELLQGSTLFVDGTIIRGNWIVGTDALVEAGALTLSSNTDWDINGGTVNVTGTVNSGTGSFANTFSVNDDGVLTVGGGTAIFDQLFVHTGGNADFTNDLRSHSTIQVQGGTVTAGSAGLTGTSNSLNHLFIGDDGSVTIEGTLRLRNGDSVTYGPPDVGSNTLTVGDFVIEGEEAYVSGPPAASLDVTVAGDFDVATTSPTMTFFKLQSVTLTFDVGGSADFEAFSTDYDVNDVNVWYGVNKCGDDAIYNARPIAELVVKAGTTLDITDDLENAYREGYSSDALYVDGPVTVESGATLNLGSIRLIYTGTLDESGTINGTTLEGTKRCYGDFDLDGDVDLTDHALLSQQFQGSGNPVDDARFDADLDTDVDLTDFAMYSQNFTGSNNPCPGSCGESSSGGGEWTVESLADWCLEHLSAGERESFAELLYALAEQAGETQDAADMAELAYLITEE